MSRYLVTGAAGFIGSHLCEHLLGEGHEVLGVDCLRDYYDPAVKRRNVAGLLDRMEIREDDLAEADLDSLLGGCDGVFHLAAQAGVRSSWGSEFACYTRDNVLASQRLFEACRGRDLERVVYASSSSIYGDAESLPTPEDTPPRPISPYGASKLMVEHLARIYFHSFEVPVVGLRYFTVYGPRQRPDMAFNRFLRMATAGEEIPVYGTGEQTRDFTYVDDAVQATNQAMGSGEAGTVYNIGGGDRTSLNRTLEILEAHLGRPIARRKMDTMLGDVRHTSADTARARRDLGYDPRIGMEEGLRRMVEWYLS